jgi:hypothetical protein
LGSSRFLAGFRSAKFYLKSRDGIQFGDHCCTLVGRMRMRLGQWALEGVGGQYTVPPRSAPCVRRRQTSDTALLCFMFYSLVG